MSFAKRQESDNGPIIPEYRCPTPYQIDFGVFLQKLVLTLQSLRKAQVVCIHPSKVATAGQIDTLIEACSQTELKAIRDKPDTCVVQPQHELGSAIRGPIVKHYEFEIPESLGQNGTYRRNNRPFAITHR
ncbi:hypothetical protein C265_24885 [Cupriavidus sp. GA3-3]|nr:hypothetical protein C265_24885 [Cupriavidus sp. GA3-3]